MIRQHHDPLATVWAFLLQQTPGQRLAIPIGQEVLQTGLQRFQVSQAQGRRSRKGEQGVAAQSRQVSLALQGARSSGARGAERGQQATAVRLCPFQEA